MSTSTLVRNQKKQYGPKVINYGGEQCRITATVRHDDQCNNGQNSFSITADIKTVRGRDVAGGCLHDEVAKHFPQLAPFIKWHLCDTDGPMHYPKNVLFLAGDRDCWGYRKGEPCRYEHTVRFDDVPCSHAVSQKLAEWLEERLGSGEFQLTSIAHDRDRDPENYKPKWTFVGFGEKWHECPFRSEAAAREFCDAMNNCTVHFNRRPVDFSDGKERELDAARRSAVWPDATDEELIADDLEQRLADRLPALLAEFQADVESLGLKW